MVDVADPTLSVRRQVKLLEISRSSIYYQAVPESALNLHLMHLMGIQAIYPRRSSGSSGPGHKRFQPWSYCTMSEGGGWSGGPE